MKPNLYSCQCEAVKENKLQLLVQTREEGDMGTQLLHIHSLFLSPRAVPHWTSERTWDMSLDMAREGSREPQKPKGLKGPLWDPIAVHLVSCLITRHTCAGVIGAVLEACTKACGVQRGAAPCQVRRGFLKKATCVSKPDKQDLIDFFKKKKQTVYSLFIC